MKLFNKNVDVILLNLYKKYKKAIEIFIISRLAKIKMIQLTKSQLIFVIGMHRSGTSALAGALHHMEINFGSNFSSAKPENSKGFFEDRDFVHLNDHLLEQINCSWYNIDEFSKEKFNTININQLYYLFYKKFSNKGCYGIKDPRLCLMIPLYIKVAVEFNMNFKIIYIERPITEVVNSLKKRDYNFNKEEIDFKTLTHSYISYSITEINQYHPLKLTYNELLFNRATFDLIAKYLNIELTEKKVKAIESFIDPNMKHNISLNK